MTPLNLDPTDLVDGEPISFAITTESADGGMVTAEAVCTRPDGTQQRALSRVAGNSGGLEIPLTITVPGQYSFDWSVKNADGAVLTRGSRAIALEPGEGLVTLGKRAIAALQPVVPFGPPNNQDYSLRAALSVLLGRVQEEFTNLAASKGTPVSSSTNSSPPQDVFRFGLALANLCKDLDLSRGHLIPFTDDMWNSRRSILRAPGAIATPLRIQRRAVVGEHEPVSIMLLNASNGCPRIKVNVKQAGNGAVVTAYSPQKARTNLGGYAWDPMTTGDRFSLMLPPLTAEEVWLDIDLANATPGKRVIEIEFEGSQGNAQAVIDLEVLPFAMVGYDKMRMCTWAQYTGNAVSDLLAHGNTVFVGNLPPVTVAEGSAPSFTIDFAPFDEFLAPMKGHDVYLLLHGIPQLGVPMESEDYVPRFAEYMKQVAGHLSEQGFKEENVALYTFDEPGGNGWNTVKQYTAFARQALKARPGLKFYVNGGADLAMFEEMAEYAGVWSPSFYMLPEQSPEMAVLRKSGKALWSYDCAVPFSRPVGANTKAINVVAQYRFSAPIAMHYGATGIGWWCYNYGPSMWEPIQYEYPLVYVNDDGTFDTSRRWEAVREGMEDARILIALRERLSDAAVSDAAKQKIRHVLDVSLPELSRQTMDEARLGFARYVIDATHNAATVEKFRSELMDCVVAVAG
jgi:hypothetical protein